jgi:hypothetical protein
MRGRALTAAACVALAAASCEDPLRKTDFLAPHPNEAARHGMYYHEKDEDAWRRYYFAHCFDTRSTFPPALERALAIRCMERMGFLYLGPRR